MWGGGGGGGLWPGGLLLFGGYTYESGAGALTVPPKICQQFGRNSGRNRATLSVFFPFFLRAGRDSGKKLAKNMCETPPPPPPKKKWTGPIRLRATGVYRVAQKKHGTVKKKLGLCSDQHFFFFTLLDRASLPHYNNTKIIKFSWELFILWVISCGLSFLGFAINLSLIVPRTLEIGQIPTKLQSIRNYS